MSPWKLDRTRLLTAQPNLQCLMFRSFNLYRNGGQCPPYKLLKPQVEHVDESTVKTGGMNVF